MKKVTALGNCYDSSVVVVVASCTDAVGWRPEGLYSVYAAVDAKLNQTGDDLGEGGEDDGDPNFSLFRY